MTRQDVRQYVGTAFIGGGATRLDLVALARANRAPASVVATLRALPNRRFAYVEDLWEALQRQPDEARGSAVGVRGPGERAGDLAWRGAARGLGEVLRVGM